MNKNLILCIFIGKLCLSWKIKDVCLHAHTHTHTQLRKENPQPYFWLSPKIHQHLVRFSENYWHPQASCRDRKDELKSQFSAGTVVWSSVFLQSQLLVCLDGTAPSMLSQRGDKGAVLVVLYLASHTKDTNRAGTQGSSPLLKAALAGSICH